MKELIIGTYNIKGGLSKSEVHEIELIDIHYLAKMASELNYLEALEKIEPVTGWNLATAHIAALELSLKKDRLNPVKALFDLVKEDEILECTTDLYIMESYHEQFGASDKSMEAYLEKQKRYHKCIDENRARFSSK